MPGKGKAVYAGANLADKVEELAKNLGLQVNSQVRVARRIWGSERRIDLVLTDPDKRKSLGIECKYQGVGGTAEEKIPATISDIASWPIPGLVVFCGEGFSQNMKAFLISTGKAVEFDDLENWLRLFFGLPLPD